MEHVNPNQLVMAQEDQPPLPRSQAIHLRLNDKMAQMRKLIDDYKAMMARIGNVFEQENNGEVVHYKKKQLALEYHRFENRRALLQAEIRNIMLTQLNK